MTNELRLRVPRTQVGDLPPDSEAKLVADTRVELPLRCGDRVSIACLLLIALVTLGVAAGALHYASSLHALALERLPPPP